MADSFVDNPIQESIQEKPAPLDMKGPGSAVARASKKEGSVDDIPQQPVFDGPDPFNSWKVLLPLCPIFFFMGLMNGVITTYTVLLYVQHYGLDLVTSTNIISSVGVGGIVSLFLGIAVSKYSDAIQTNFGRRKPFVVAGFLVQFVGVLILTNPQVGNVHTYPAQVAIGNIAGVVGNALWVTPWNSWLIESIRNQATYAKVYALGACITVIGLILAIVVGAIGNQPHVILAGVVVFGIISLPLLIYFVPNPILQEAPAQPPLVPSLRTCIRTAEFRTILLNTVALSIGLTLGQEFLLIVLYSCFGFTHQKEVNGALFVTAIAVPIGTCVFIPLIAWSVGKFEKIHLYRGLSVLMWVLALMSVLAMIPGIGAYSGDSYSDSTLLSYYTLYIISQVGLICAAAIPIGFINSLFLRDLVIYDNFVNNVDRENVYQQALLVPVSIVATVVGGFFKAMIYATGFHGTGTKKADDDYIQTVYTWNVDTLWQVAFYVLVVTTIATFIALYSLRDYPLTTVVSEQMSKVVKRRAAAKAADLEQREQDNARESIVSRAREEAEKQVFIDEVNLWNSLSRLEVDHIVGSPTADGENVGLKEIKQRNFYGAFIFAPLAIGAVMYGAISQLVNQGVWATMAIVIFTVPVFYMYYEVTRMFQMDTLSKLPPDDLKEQAEAAKASNDKYQVTVQSLIDENGIVLDDSFAENNLPTTSEGRARSSTLAKPLPPGTLSGYKRQWAAMGIIVVIGVTLGAIANP